MQKQELFWLSISILLLAAALVLWLLKRQRLRKARSWPAQMGKIVSTDVRWESRGDKNSVYVAEAVYVFELDGSSHSDKIRRTFMFKGKAEKWVSNYPQGRPVTVHYNPEKYADCVMFEDEQEAMHFIKAS